jgi:hypothetical protein
LSLKVSKLDKVPIDDPQLSDSGASKHFCMRCSEGAATNKKNACFEEPFLAGATYLRKEGLSTVSFAQAILPIQKVCE